MSAIVNIRDRTGTIDASSVNLGLGISGVPGVAYPLSLVNIGDRAAQNVKVEVVAAPTSVNLSGAPLTSMNATGSITPAAQGDYTILFSRPSGIPKASVNGAAAVTIVADGSTPNTNLITGLGVVVAASMAGGDQVRISVGDGHIYTLVAPDVAGTPGSYSASVAIGTVASGPSAFTSVTIANVIDSTLDSLQTWHPVLQGMTSDTQGAVTVSSDQSSNAWYVFDTVEGESPPGGQVLNIGTGGGSFNILVDFGSGNSQTIGQYQMSALFTNGPKTWVLEGSPDNATWTTLDSQTGFTGTWDYYVAQQFAIATPGSYRYYRFSFTGGSQSNPVTYVIGEIVLQKLGPMLDNRLYEYAIVGAFPDGTFTTPVRISVTPAGTVGSKNVLSWDTPLAGISSVLVFMGNSPFSENLIGILPPSATGFEDKVGSPSIHGGAYDWDWMFNAENGPSGLVSEERVFGTFGPATLQTSSVNFEYFQFVGQSMQLLGVNCEVHSNTFDQTTGHFQCEVIPDLITTNLVQFGIDPTSATGSIIIGNLNSQLSVTVFENGVDVTSTYGGTYLSGSPLSLPPNKISLLTIAWSTSGLTFYVNDQAGYSLPGLTSLVRGKFSDNTDALLLWNGNRFDDIAAFTFLPTSDELTLKSSIIARANALDASVFRGPLSGTAQQRDFWVAEQTPPGTPTTLTPRTFRLRVSGDSL